MSLSRPGFTNVRYDFVVETAAIRFAAGVDTSSTGISSFHFVFVSFPVASEMRREERTVDSEALPDGER